MGRGEVTRTALLRAAADVIAEDGWGAVTTRRVAERAGVRPGLVHYHFSSIGSLRAEAALSVAALPAVEEAVGSLLDALVAQTGAHEAMEHLLAATLRSEMSATTRILSEALVAAGRDESLRRRLAGSLTAARNAVSARLVTLGTTPRAPGHDAGAEATATVLLAALDGLALHQAINPTLRGRDLAAPLLRLVGAGGAPR